MNGSAFAVLSVVWSTLCGTVGCELVHKSNHSKDNSTKGSYTGGIPRCSSEACQRRYQEARSKHPPSPKDLTKYFHVKQKAKEAAVAAKKAYMTSDEHHVDMIRASNRMARERRQHLPNTKLESLKAKLRGPGCGHFVPAAELGLRDTALVHRIFGSVPREALLQKRSFHARDPSMSQPKAGATQTLKDEGASTMGAIASASKDEAVEPYVKIFKDGFSSVACAKDNMYDF